MITQTGRLNIKEIQAAAQNLTGKVVKNYQAFKEEEKAKLGPRIRSRNHGLKAHVYLSADQKRELYNSVNRKLITKISAPKLESPYPNIPDRLEKLERAFKDLKEGLKTPEQIRNLAMELLANSKYHRTGSFDQILEKLIENIKSLDTDKTAEVLSDMIERTQESHAEELNQWDLADKGESVSGSTPYYIVIPSIKSNPQLTKLIEDIKEKRNEHYL